MYSNKDEYKHQPVLSSIRQDKPQHTHYIYACIPVCECIYVYMCIGRHAQA